MPYFDDDGNELDPSAVPLPRLCTMCENHGIADEKILCDLNRLDQADNADFRCAAFVSLYGVLIDDIII